MEKVQDWDNSLDLSYLVDQCRHHQPKNLLVVKLCPDYNLSTLFITAILLIAFITKINILR
jgi:hypothetical protein